MDVAGHTLDATVYPETDDMGEHEVQRYISELLRALVVYWLATNQRTGHTGANQFFYWVQGDPTKSRAPDVYVIDGLPQDHPDQGVWKTWEGHVPAFALEVVSSKRRKDYDEAPADYDAIGTQELLLFDPAATARSRKRVRWQVFRQVRGKLRRVVTRRAEGAERRALTERIARETLAVQLQNERDARGEAEAALARALAELEQLRHRR